jgi:hypothetical protein
LNYGIYGDECSGSITMENFLESLISVACEVLCCDLLPACDDSAHLISVAVRFYASRVVAGIKD